MKPEWPIVPPGVELEQQLLPLAMREHVELVRASDAVTAFCERRSVQMLPPYNHTPDKDLERSIDFLVREAMYRLDAVVERTGRGLMHPPPGIRDLLIRKLEIAGGLLIAAHARMCAELPPEEGD